MSLERLMSASKLKSLRFDLRDDYICSSLSVDKSLIRNLRSLPDEFEKIKQAANLIYERSKGKVNPGTESAQITLINLSSVLGLGDLEKGRKRIEYLISSNFDETIKTRFKLDSTQKLRTRLNLYSGNLLDAEKKYDNFMASRSDFQRNINIPLQENDLVDYVLGAMWSQGQIKKNTSSYTIKIQFPQSDYPIILATLIDSLFNCGSNVYENINKPHEVNIKGNKFFSEENESHCININSLSVSTWVMYDLNLMDPLRPNIPRPKNPDAFLAGLVDASGEVMLNEGKYPICRISSKHDAIHAGVKNLAESLGYSSSYSDKRTTIGKKVLIELLGHMKNESKISIIKDYF